jgi:hypothetical protein
VTDGLDQALVNAGLALLAADPLSPALVVYDGIVPVDPATGLTKPPPYVLVYSTVEWPAGAQGDGLDGLSRSPTVRWITHSVGKNAVDCRAIAQRVRTQLLNARPTIAGLDLGLIRQESGAGPPTRDETTGTPVMDAITVYRLSAAS